MAITPVPDSGFAEPIVLDPSVRRLVRAAAGGAILIVMLLLALAGWQLYGTLKTENGLTAAARDEWVAARADHAGIIAIAAQCQQAGTAFTHPLVVPAALTTIVPNGWHGPATPKPAQPESDQPALTLEAPSYLLASIILINDIGRSRVDVAGNTARDNAWMQVFEWALVLIGAITTVLISIKSISADRGTAFTAVGIGAIIFSTLGTSVAAVNSFYSPRTTYEHDQRTLADLRNLHLQLATGIAREGNLCTSWVHWSRDWRFARIKALTDQYASITDASRVGGLPAEGDGGMSGGDTLPAGVPSASNGVVP